MPTKAKRATSSSRRPATRPGASSRKTPYERGWVPLAEHYAALGAVREQGNIERAELVRLRAQSRRASSTVTILAVAIIAYALFIVLVEQRRR